jgi:hypothetical protein
VPKVELMDASQILELNDHLGFDYNLHFEAAAAAVCFEWVCCFYRRNSLWACKRQDSMSRMSAMLYVRHTLQISTNFELSFHY